MLPCKKVSFFSLASMEEKEAFSRGMGSDMSLESSTKINIYHL